MREALCLHIGQAGMIAQLRVTRGTGLLVASPSLAHCGIDDADDADRSESLTSKAAPERFHMGEADDIEVLYSSDTVDWVGATPSFVTYYEHQATLWDAMQRAAKRAAAEAVETALAQLRGQTSVSLYYDGFPCMSQGDLDVYDAEYLCEPCMGEGLRALGDACLCEPCMGEWLDDDPMLHVGSKAIDSDVAGRVATDGNDWMHQSHENDDNDDQISEISSIWGDSDGEDVESLIENGGLPAGSDCAAQAADNEPVGEGLLKLRPKAERGLFLDFPDVRSVLSDNAMTVQPKAKQVSDIGSLEAQRVREEAVAMHRAKQGAQDDVKGTGRKPRPKKKKKTHGRR